MRMSRVAGCIAIGIVLATGVGSVEADTHYVLPGQSIQKAINATKNGDEIQVSPGTYTESIDFKGKAVRLYSSGGPEVTTIDGTGHSHVVQCASGEGMNTVLEGFTLTGGNATGAAYPDNVGGGMFNELSSPTIIHCTFLYNVALAGGGQSSSLFLIYLSEDFQILF